MALRSLIALAAVAAAAAQGDQITNLPGVPALNFSQYAGYLNVDATNGRNLFYWHAESQNSPSTDPLVLWLNGGPGCSSLGGMFTENGPFVVQADGATIELNPWSWNKVANMIWMEAPAGVGFSYSNTPGDYNTNDVQTADDNLAALLQFFARYPSFAGRDFYIAGESYAGHYVPELAWTIIQYNAANPSSPINLAGIAVGNGLTDELIDFQSNIFYFYNHALVSPWAFDAAYAACGNGTLFAACSGYVTTPPCPTACANALTPLNNQVGNIDPYDIYGDLCLSDSKNSKVDAVTGKRSIGAGGSGLVKGETAAHVMMRNHPVWQSVLKARAQRNKALRASKEAQVVNTNNLYPSLAGLDDQNDDPFVPCIDDYVATYLNTPAVKAAIHANASITWVDCNQGSLNYLFNHSSMLPIYQDFSTQAPKMKVLIYSGDADSVLPFLGTEWNVQALGRTITTDWAEWTGSDGQPGGYVVALTHAAGNDLHFLTIKGAGHMVPGTQPTHALDFFSRYISGQPF